jgi:uncharacterized membrane protein
MGLALILIGIIVWLFINSLLGVILVILGLVLFFVPWDSGYGYSHFRGRRGP